MATRQHYSYVVGETWIMDITDTEADGSPLNLLGATAYFKITKRDGTVVQDLTSPTGISIVTPSTGTARLQIGPPSTSVDPDTYKYQHRVLLADGTVTVQGSGYIIAKPTL